MNNGFLPALPVGKLPSAGGVSVHVGRHTLAVFRLGDEIFAIDGVCPHRGAPLASGAVEEGKVYCPLHGWGFDLRTGACADNPAKPVRSYPVRVVDGVVQVQV